MPGGRLTQHERQQIAMGLADSLPYAEIARRLDRPTSTITREVMRNGGPTAYRADLAHRATERRARRRRPASSRGAASVPQPHGRDAEAVAEYEETLTTVLMASGLPKMTARVLTCLFTTDAGSLAASQLATPPGQPGVHLQGDRLPGEPEPRPPRTRRTPPRPYVVDDELFYQATIASARSNDQPPKPHAKASPSRPPHPRRRPPGEHRRLPRLHQRKHHPRRRTGPRRPPHQS